MDLIFLRLAFRNLLKNKLNTFINVFGFSTGIAACLFIFLFIKYEKGFDRSYPDPDRIFRIVETLKNKDRSEKSGFVWYPVASEFKAETPGIKDFCRVSDYSQIKCLVDKNQFTLDKLCFADGNFFRFFNFRLISGSEPSVLDGAEKIVLTNNTARRIFGSDDAIGKTILIQHQIFTVSGIAEDPPSDSHLAFDAIASVKSIEQNKNYYKGWGGGYTFLSYLKLDENTTASQVEKSFPSFLDRKINDRWKLSGMFLSMDLQNIKDIHLSDGTISYDCQTNRNKRSLYVISSICLLILILAAINYIVLYSVQSLARSKDLGIMRIQGAGRLGLFVQSLFELLILTGFSSMAGLLLLVLTLPFLNVQLQTGVTISNNLPVIVFFLLIVIVLLALIIAFISTRKILASDLIDSIKQKFLSSRHGQLENNLLIAFQFTIVLILLISLSVITRQNSFLLNHDLGFDKNNVLVMEPEDQVSGSDLDGFKQDLRQLASVISVSLTSQPVGSGLTKNGYILEGQQQSSLLNVIYTDQDFLDCFNIKIIKGRNFDKSRESDKTAVLINQKLEKFSGWENPLEKTILRNGKLKVIGVVNDFNFSSLENAIGPMLIMSNPAWDGWYYSIVNVKFRTTDSQGMIKQINKIWRNHFPDISCNIGFLDNALASNYQSLKVQQRMLEFFSLLSMFIATIGLLGMAISSTRNRISEIGIRKVNGAMTSEIIFMLNSQFVKWLFFAFIISCPAAIILMHRWLENFAYKVSFNLFMFIIPGLFALAISIITITWQSYRIASRNPVEALRYE